VHCVDCVQGAVKSSPARRTAFGAQVRDRGPVATYVLIGLNIASFLLQLIVGRVWTDAMLFYPYGGQTEPWRFLTSAFVHQPNSIFHIAFNMYALWVVGQALEPALGRLRYVTLYLLSAFGGSTMMLLVATYGTESWLRGVYGASGAVFGLFGAVLVILHRLHRPLQSMITILVINAVIGFVVPNIAWQAHLGGFLVGVGLGAAFAYAPRGRQRAVGVVATAAVTVLIVVLALVKYAMA
jgi:membrane associated rhomboid family serine protease